MKHTLEEKKEAFGRLLEVMDELREKCPWDSKQTFESLRTLTIEEVYELAEAVSTNNLTDLKKELGDVLMHITFYALIASETDKFDIKDVCDAVCEKLIYRHPHIFGDVQVANSEQVAQNWEQLKLKEKGGNRTVLQGVPSALPALVKAYRIQDKARNAGFDWDERSQVWQKVREEISESCFNPVRVLRLQTIRRTGINLPTVPRDCKIMFSCFVKICFSFVSFISQSRTHGKIKLWGFSQLSPLFFCLLL